MLKKEIIEEKRTVIGMFLVIIVAVILVGLGAHRTSHPTDYARLDYDRYVVVGNYKNLEYELNVQEISDEDVKTAAEEELGSQGSLLQTHEPAKEGDTVVIDYTGLIDGKIFEGGSAQDSTLTLGSNVMIDGFEDAIIGHKEGDTFSIDLVFPDNYEEKSLAGKPVTFDVTIKYVTEFNAVKYNDENVALYTKYKTVQEHQEAVRKDLEIMAELNAEDAAIIQLWEQVLEASKIKEYPDKILKEQIEADTKDYIAYLTEDGGSLEAALKEEGMTKEEWDQRVEDAAKSTVKSNLLMYAIADKENIDLSRDTYEQYVKEELTKMNMTEEEFEVNHGVSVSEYIEDPDSYLGFVYQRVGEKLMELGVEKEK